MIRKLGLGLVLIAALSLAGCKTTETGSEVTISDVQSTAVEICGFLPTAQTALALIGAFGGYDVTTAIQVANAVCDTVDRKAVTLNKVQAWKVKVNGKVIVIEGSFVKR